MTAAAHRWTRLSRLALGVIALAMAVPVAGATGRAAGPEPSPVPKRWQLDVDVGPIRTTTIEVKGRGLQAYHYLTYRVTNNSGRDVLFAPAWDLATDEATVFRSGRDVPVEVTRRIMDDLANPFLRDQIEIIGPLLQGKENAKQGVVIWPARDLKVEYLQVFAAGFSGETATIEVPDPKTGGMGQVLLRKTLMLKYRSPGEIDPTDSRPLDLVEKRWIMR
jgi:hypothetical protein